MQKVFDCGYKILQKMKTKKVSIIKLIFIVN